MDDLAVSVVIPTFNASRWVGDALTSVLQQSLPPREVIVVDDGSTDGTVEVVRDLYPSVTVRATPNFGRAAARNCGLSMATADWVAFLDHDDLFHRRKLEVVARYLAAEPRCEALNHLVWCFAERPGVPSPFGMEIDFQARDVEECHREADRHPTPVNSFEHLRTDRTVQGQLDRSRGIVSATVVRRDLAVRAGGFPVFATGGEDLMFFAQVARFADWQTLREPLGFCRCHPGQGTHDGAAAAGVLGLKVGAWYSGRPLERPTGAAEVRAALVAHREDHRHEVRAHVASAVRRRDLRQAWLLWRLGALLLPRWRDRIRALAPRRHRFAWRPRRPR